MKDIWKRCSRARGEGGGVESNRFGSGCMCLLFRGEDREEKHRVPQVIPHILSVRNESEIPTASGGPYIPELAMPFLRIDYFT